MISPDFEPFSHRLPLGRRNLPMTGFSNVIFLGLYFCSNGLSFTAVSTLRVNGLQPKSV